MRFPTLFSIRSNDSTLRQYDSFGGEDEESLPPPPPPLSAPPSPQSDSSSPPQWSPDDVSAMTAPSGLGTMSNVEALETNNHTPSKESQGGRYVDGFPPSPGAAVELELAIYERLEKARKVENDLARDEQNRRDSRKRRLCSIAILLLAVLALSIGLARGLNPRTVEVGHKESTPSENSPTSNKEGTSSDSLAAKTDGPFIKDNLSIMLVGLTSGLSSDARHILEQDYCAFFADYYNNPREPDWLRSNVDIAECSVDALEINRRRLNAGLSTSGLIVNLNQTLTLEFSNAGGNFTYIKASIDYVVSAPFKDRIAVASLVEKLKNQSETDEFSNLKDIHFAPEPIATTGSQAPASLLPEDIAPVPTKAPSETPSEVPTTHSPTAIPTAKPTNLPWNEEKDEKGKDKDKKKKNTKGKI